MPHRPHGRASIANRLAYVERVHGPDIARRVALRLRLKEDANRSFEPLIVWFARELVKKRLPGTRDDDTNIRDWFRGVRGVRGVDIGKLTYSAALLQANQWHAEQAVLVATEAVPEIGTVVKRWKDGVTLQALTTPAQLADEGHRMHMGHCVATYSTSVESGRCRIYSLRDAGGKSRITFEVSTGDEPTIRQCKGPGNTVPDVKWWPYVHTTAQALRIPPLRWGEAKKMAPGELMQRIWGKSVGMLRERYADVNLGWRAIEEYRGAGDHVSAYLAALKTSVEGENSRSAASLSIEPGRFVIWRWLSVYCFYDWLESWGNEWGSGKNGIMEDLPAGPRAAIEALASIYRALPDIFFGYLLQDGDVITETVAAWLLKDTKPPSRYDIYTEGTPGDPPAHAVVARGFTMDIPQDWEGAFDDLVEWLSEWRNSIEDPDNADSSGCAERLDDHEYMARIHELYQHMSASDLVDTLEKMPAAGLEFLLEDEAFLSRVHHLRFTPEVEATLARTGLSPVLLERAWQRRVQLLGQQRLPFRGRSSR